VNLFLLRHAEAEERSSSGKDADRKLTPGGAETMRIVAHAFERLAEIELILTSPLVRARETAQFVKERFPKAAFETTEALSPSARASEIVDELAGRKEGNILLVGHQPHLGSLLGFLLVGKASVEVPMKKAAAARLSFSGAVEPPGKLRWLMSPELAERVK
jgi:phosphohistidine phosphatase